MGADDALLSELGVTARGERDVARDVIRDAALAAAARAASARRAPAAADDEEAAEAGDAGTGPGETRGGAGGGGGADPGLPSSRTHTPATRELRRLREEAATVAAELASVRDALDDVRAKAAEGTAPADAPLVIAVGERRVAGLVEKRAALRARVRDAEAVVSAEADAARTGGFGRAAATPPRRRETPTDAPRAPPRAATLDEDDDLDALLDSISAGGPRARAGETVLDGRPGAASSRAGTAGETERERLIRAGVLTPFASLDGFERRVASAAASTTSRGVDPAAATAHAVAATRAWREGRSRAVLLEGDAVPQQQPAARPFARHGGARAADVGAGARMAEKRREWRGKSDAAAAALERELGGRKRRRRRQRDAAYSSDEEHTEEEEEEEAEVEVEVARDAPEPAEGPPRRARGKKTREVKREPAAATVAAGGSGSGGFVIPKREPRDAAARTTASGRGEDASRSETKQGGRWACPACTFANPGGDACALCETPRSAVALPSADDDVEFVGEVPAPEGPEGSAKARRGPARANGGASGVHPGGAAAPPPRRAAEVARRRAGRAAEAEAEELSVSASGSEYGGESEEEEEEDDDDVDLEEELPEEDEEQEMAVPRRARTARGGGVGATRAASSRAPVPSRRARAPPPVPPPGAESEILFDGGLRLPTETYDSLLEHQKTSLKWLWELHCQRAGGIIGDEMGLGKTVQVAAFLCALERSGLYQPSLVVCPATMLRQWRRELRIWAPRLNPSILHVSAVSAAALAAAGGDKKLARRKMLRSCVNDPKGVVLTTYEHVRGALRDSLLSIRWGYAVLDEGHKIRNPDADVTICAKQLQTVHRLIMTGAPIQNRLSELWSLFDFCFPGKLGTLPVFQAEFAAPIQVGGYANASEQQVVTAFRCATTLKDLISPFLLRRMKADVNIALPAKTEQVLFCPMTSDQREAYRAYVHSRDVEEILEGRREALSGIDVLRKIVNHPDLLERQTKATHVDYGNAERSGKQMVTMKVLSLWREQKHRALLFSQTQQMLDILEAAVADAGYVYRRMDGTTPVQHRMRLIDEFNSDENVFVFLLTTKVGGLGVNLTGADRVLLFDPDWNPSTDAQARERAWRIGQRKEVTVYRLVTAGTIEEKVYHRQIYKEFLTSKVLRDPKQRRFFKAKDLADLFAWEEDARRGGDDGGDGGAAIETAELFAEVEGELRAADFERGDGAASSSREEEDGEIADATNDDEPNGAEKNAWDPSAVPGSATTGRNARKKHAPGGFRVADAPSSISGGDDGEGDAAIMRSLFGGGGGGGGGTIRGAMNHDAIVNASGGRDHLVGGSAAAEADRVARRAHAAVTQSGRARLASNVAVPTWTGRSGAAGAPQGAQAARAVGRFGRRAEGAPSGFEPGTTPSTQNAPGGAGVAGASANRVGGSQTLLRRIRDRDAAAAAARVDAAAADVELTETQVSAELLLRDVVAFLRARPEGRAPSGLVVDAFQDRVGPTQHALFRRLLKVAATLEKNPPNAAGRGGGAAWVLKDEFR